MSPITLTLLAILSLISLSLASIPTEYISQASVSPHTISVRTPQELQKALSTKNHLLFFTVHDSLKSQCPFCHVFKAEYEKLATQYWNLGNRANVFFLVEYQTDMMSLIQTLGLRQLPSLYYMKTKQMCDMSRRMQDCIKDWTGVKLSVAQQMTPDKIAEAQKMQQQRQGGGASQQQMAQAAHNNALSIRTILYLFAIAGLGVAIFAARKIGALPIFLVTSAWFVYLVSLGGIVFNWINNPPPFQMSPQGGVAFFFPSHMQQLSMEGYIAGAMMLLNAFSFLAMGEFVPSLKSATTRRLVSCALIATWVGSALLVVGFFMLKNSWYMSGTPFSVYLQLLKALMSR